MNNVNQELQHQIEVLRAQRFVEINGPISQVNNFIQALSRIYELAADVAKMEYKLDEIKKATLGVSAKNAEDTFYTIIGILDE